MGRGPTFHWGQAVSRALGTRWGGSGSLCKSAERGSSATQSGGQVLVTGKREAGRFRMYSQCFPRDAQLGWGPKALAAVGDVSQGTAATGGAAVGSLLGPDWAIVPYANSTIEADAGDQHWHK